MTRAMRFSRRGFAAGGAALLLAGARPAAAEGAWPAFADGAAILFRHANAPGTGDPPGLRLDDCATQRNLDDMGRAQARAIGAAFRARGVTVGRVLSSRWCRARETAELAFPGQVAAEPAFDSFFGDTTRRAAATEAARRVLAAWRGPGVLVAVTHQVNITALTGIFPQSGEGIVLEPHDGAVRAIGRLRPGPDGPIFVR